MSVSGLLRGAYRIAQRGAVARFLPLGAISATTCALISVPSSLPESGRPGGLRGRAEQVKQQRAAIGQPILVALFGGSTCGLAAWMARLLRVTPSPMPVPVPRGSAGGRAGPGADLIRVGVDSSLRTDIVTINLVPLYVRR